MCGQPKKVKFQFYNINLNNFDLRLIQQQQAFTNDLGDKVDENDFNLYLLLDGYNDEEYPPSITDLVDKKDLHHFDKDETLGNFLVRMTQ